MMNRNSLIKILLVSILVVGNSCSDEHLQLAPTSNYNAANFYNSESDFEFAINGAYAPLRSLHNADLIYFLKSLSDNRIVGGQYDFHLLNQFRLDATSADMERIWQDFYLIVSRSNLILDNIDNENIEYSSEERRSNIKGEAHFLRGYAYFHLGWLWGGVPLIDREMSVEEVRNTVRSTQSETFDFAAQDLMTAASLLPETWPSDELGKATKYSAEGLLARLYLLQNRFSEAKPLLESVINSGLYQLADQYSHAFLDTYDNSPEHVFQVQYTSGLVGQGNSYPRQNAPESITSEDPFFPHQGHWNVIYASESLWNAYEEEDIRRDFTLKQGYLNQDGSPSDAILFIKYNHGTHPESPNDYEVNLPVLRYTDVKLMYAEVLNEEGYNPSGEAFSILNEIRDRAELEPLTSADVPSQEAFREAILHERRLEFAHEYLRWFDLYRTDTAISVMNSRPDADAANTMDEHHLLLPIPQHELNVVANDQILWQNPGY